MVNIAPTLDNTLGALFIGLSVSLALFGISCAQIWHYYIKCSRDRMTLKALVAAVMISDTISLILICVAMYSYAITHYAEPAYLNTVHSGLVIQVIFNGITAVLVEAFFVWRIYRLSGKNLWMTGTIVLMILAQFACNIGYTAVTLQIDTFDQAHKDWTAALDLSQALTDVVISGLMVYLLWGSRTEFSKTNSMIDKLIVFAVNTGLITSLCAVSAIIAYYLLTNTLIYVSIYILVGRLYCNSLFATLNARSYIRGEATSYSLDQMGAQSRTAGGIIQATNRTREPGGISVQIETFKENSPDHRSSHELTHKRYNMA